MLFVGIESQAGHRHVTPSLEYGGVSTIAELNLYLSASIANGLKFGEFLGSTEEAQAWIDSCPACTAALELARGEGAATIKADQGVLAVLKSALSLR